MPLVLNVKGFKKPLLVISESLDFLKDLKPYGLKEKQIRKILYEPWARSKAQQVVALDLSDPKTRNFYERAKARQKKYSGTIRRLSACISDELIPIEIKKKLMALRGKLQEEKNEIEFDGFYPKLNFEKAKLRYPGPRNPKSETQKTGFIIRDLHDYLRPIMDKLNGVNIKGRDYSQKDIWRFISELLSKNTWANWMSGLEGNAIPPARVRVIYNNSIRVK
jgi:hypothetical protein